MTTDLLSLNSDDAMKMIIVKSHVGTTKCNFQVKQYQWKQRVEDGIHILDVKKIWEKIVLAARVIAAVENPADVCVVSSNVVAQRALLKFAAHTGATAICGRFVPGSFTNQMQKNFKQPRLLVVSDCRIDYQAVAESALVNIPVISFCNTDSPMKYVDVAIPCNNKDGDSIGLMWWFLAREVLYLRGNITREIGFIIDGKIIMPDLYFYRDPKEQEKEEQVEMQDEPTGVIEEPKMPEFIAPTATIDFDMPDIGNWADASSFAPAAIQNVAPEANPQDGWGVGNVNGW